MKLLLDEMLSPGIAKAFRAQGGDVACVSESEAWRGSTDQEVLELATSQERVLVTANVKDFVALHRDWALLGRSHGGILLVSEKTFPSDRSRTGRIGASLAARQTAGDWPDPGELDFLREGGRA